jgi:Ca2+-binding RTX toxin-like protein
MATTRPTTISAGTSQTVSDPNDIAQFQIEFWGTDYADVLYGNVHDNRLYGAGGNDTLMGDAGADQFHGGAGIDTANYRNSQTYVSLDLAAGRGYAGDAKGDTYYSIENVVGSRYNDIIGGDSQANVLDGGTGNDTLYGRGGIDTLVGSTGNDTLVGGQGADVLDGGRDTDTASYEDAGYYMLGGVQFGVIADLAAGIGEYGDAYGDTYHSIENLTGSAYADMLYGDANANYIYGGDRNDYLYGRAGNDTLIGGFGDDVLTGGSGADDLNGGRGRDLADYSDSNVGVTIRLGTTSSNGTAEGDTYWGIEDARGSDFADHFYGMSGDNRMYGEGGNDTFHGGGGPDLYDGGSGLDHVTYEASSSAVTVDLAAGGTAGDAAGDTYVSIENLTGSRHELNELRGNNLDNTILSLGRLDYVYGNGGADDITVANLATRIYGGDGDDTIEVSFMHEITAWEGSTGFNGEADMHRLLVFGDNLESSQGNNQGDGIDTVTFSSQGFTGAMTHHFYVSVSLEDREFRFHSLAYDTTTEGSWPHNVHTYDGRIYNVENVVGTEFDSD